MVGNEVTTAEEIHRRVSNVANLLKWSGIAAGDRVLVTMLPSADLYASILAVFAVGKRQYLCVHTRMCVFMCVVCIAYVYVCLCVWCVYVHVYVCLCVYVYLYVCGCVCGVCGVCGCVVCVGVWCVGVAYCCVYM